MKPAPFIYERPTSIEAALALLADGQYDTKILAGGQSLVPMMNFRVARPERLIDINALRNLDYIRREDDELVIGALVRHAEVKNAAVVRLCAPIIIAAYDRVAHGPVRNRGTLAGNLCHADPASEMSCLMLALDATLVVRSIAGERRIPAAGFFKDVYQTALEPHEMLIEIRIPLDTGRRGWGFHEVSLRRGDFALACACALMTIAEGTIATVAIGVAGIANRALRLRNVESLLVGKLPSPVLFADVANAAADNVDLGDRQVPSDYRRHLVKILTRRALLDASVRAGNQR